jgi:superfamily I DNA/RNA helicase
LIGTFWIQADQLDADQDSAYKAKKLDESYLIRGPAGSGKTNLLLLRAKWFRFKNVSNVKLVGFTASLCEFMRRGCENYELSTEIVTTCSALFRSILAEHGVQFNSVNDFEVDRDNLAGQVYGLIESSGISGSFEALLVDEAQDYSDTELLVFKKLAKRLILCADHRQSIYKTTHSKGLLESLVSNNVVMLEHHYRSGRKICKVADAIIHDGNSENLISSKGHYDEKSMPSSVESFRHQSKEEQNQEILARVFKQISLYPTELIGVLFPKREQVVTFREALAASPLAVNLTDNLIVETLHSAKGLEFRALQIGGLDELRRLGPTQRRLIYTGILRGKTAVTLHAVGEIPGYLEQGLHALQPPRPNPSDDDIFGIRK